MSMGVRRDCMQSCGGALGLGREVVAELPPRGHLPYPQITVADFRSQYSIPYPQPIPKP